MYNYDEFEKTVNIGDFNALKRESAQEVPDGTYIVGITNINVQLSKSSGKPMLVVNFKITDEENEYFDKNLTMYQSIGMQYGINAAKNFLYSLDTPITVQYENDEKFQEICRKILTEIKGNNEFDLEYSTNEKGYKNFKIIGVYDLVDSNS